MDKFDKIIEKPWGNEEVIYKDDEVAVWRLYIKSGERTSFHCHPNKKTIMIVLKGEVKCYLKDSSKILKQFDSLVLERGEYHSIGVNKDSSLIEIDSPPLLDDIFRLEDKYGRAGKPYWEDDIV